MGYSYIDIARSERNDSQQFLEYIILIEQYSLGSDTLLRLGGFLVWIELNVNKWAPSS